MSLSEVILEIAEDMVRDSLNEDADLTDSDYPRLLHSYAKQLKVAVKASEGNPAPFVGSDSGSLFIHPDAQHFQMIEQARKELRAQKRMADGMEAGELRFAVCQGGPADGDTVSIGSDMPLGARTMIDGAVYSLQGGKLEFDEEATRARKEGNG